MSTRDFQAAADCITNIEALQTQSNSKLYNQTLLFAKIMIAVAQDDAHAAYSLLTTLLQFQSTDGHFDALLCAAKSVADIVLKGGSSASGYSDIYKLLSLRFPK